MKLGHKSPLLLPPFVMAMAFIAPVFGIVAPPDGDRPPAPCGIECIQVAVKAAADCREAGGGFVECAKKFAETMATCRADAGCDTPVRPPICGEECLTAARDAARACKEAGGDEVAACYADVKAKLKECLTAAGCDLPTPPDGPPRCGLTCLKDAVGTARDCLKGGGDFRECAAAFVDAIKACRASSDCGDGDDPSPGEEPEVLALVLEDSFIRGDANRDGVVDISDPVSVLGFVFLGTDAPACADAADASDDGKLDISDPILILSVLFRGTGSLPQPFPGEGFDPTADSVTCGVP